MLLKSLDLHPTIDNSFLNQYFISYGNRNVDVGSLSKITTIKTLNSNNFDKGLYVYDLTTENHHFHAGIGEGIVHNTDSIFIDFNENEVFITNKYSKKLGFFERFFNFFD